MVKSERYKSFNKELLEDLKKVKNENERRTLEGMISYGFSRDLALEVLVEDSILIVKSFMYDEEAINICNKISNFKL